MVAHVFVSGFVQGVGFRRFVRHHALELGLAGWVTNLKDNRVEAMFCGPKEKLEKIIAICRKGAFLSEVKDVDVIWEEDSKENTYETFEITY